MKRLLNLRRVGFSFWVSKPKAAPRSAWMDPA